MLSVQACQVLYKLADDCELLQDHLAENLFFIYIFIFILIFYRSRSFRAKLVYFYEKNLAFSISLLLYQKCDHLLIYATEKLALQE